MPDLRLPGPVRAVAVPVRAALHALLRAQAPRVHHVADRHEAPESGEFKIEIAKNTQHHCHIPVMLGFHLYW